LSIFFLSFSLSASISVLSLLSVWLFLRKSLLVWRLTILVTLAGLNGQQEARSGGLFQVPPPPLMFYDQQHVDRPKQPRQNPNKNLSHRYLSQ